MEQTANERAIKLLAQFHKMLDEKIQQLDWVPELTYPVEVSLFGSADAKFRGMVEIQFRAPFNRIQMEKDAETLKAQGCSAGLIPDESDAAATGYLYQSWWKGSNRFVIIYDPKMPGSICQVRKIGERLIERETQTVGIFEFACE